MPLSPEEVYNLQKPGERLAIHEPKRHPGIKIGKRNYVFYNPDDPEIQKVLAQYPDRRLRQGEIPTQKPEITLPQSRRWAR